MVKTTLFCILIALVGTAGAIDIEAPTSVSTCSDQLVRVTAKPSLPGGVVKLKPMFPADLDFVAIDGGIAFAAGPRRTIQILAVEATNDGGFTFEFETVAIEIIDDVAPPEPDEPEPPMPPSDPDPPAGDIRDEVLRLAMQVPEEHRGLAEAIADNYEAASKMDGETLFAVITELTVANRVTTAAPEAREAWVPFFVGAFELLPHPDDVAAYRRWCAGVAAGLRRVAGVNARERYGSVRNKETNWSLAP